MPKRSHSILFCRNPLLWLVFALIYFFCPAAIAQNLPIEKIKLPKGFRIEIYVRDIPSAREMALSPGGTLFVGSRTAGKVYAVVDGKDGTKPRVITIAQNLNMPNGVAFRDGSLYVSEVNRILRYDRIETNLTSPPEPVLLTDEFPKNKEHGWKFIRFGPDGRLYVPVGAPCNICEQRNPVYASITRMKPDGSDFEIYARGIRNTVGFDWHPKTGELWFTDNGRDWLGDNQPPDELNRAQVKGMHFGFPLCNGDTPDPKYGKGKDCRKFTSPAMKLAPHAAALGMRFYTGKMFPEEYRNQIFIAEHGSWNRSVPIGYRITLVKLEGKRAKSYEVFAEGWLQGRSAWGRPVDVEIMPDGSLLVSDDKAGVIYRISYKKD